MIILFMLTTFFGYSQSPQPTANFTSSDGLASNTVYDIKEDSQGFLWIGTENGLSRFDGKKFINYGIKEGLESLDVLELLFDKKNRLWLSTLDQSMTYFLNGRIHHLKDEAFARSSLKTQGAYATGDSLVFYRTDKIIILSVEDLATINILDYGPTNTYMKHGIKKSLGKAPFNDLYKGEYVFFDTMDKAIKTKNLKTGSTRTLLAHHSNLIKSASIKKIVESVEHQEKLYARTGEGLLIFDLVKDKNAYQHLLPQHDINRYTKSQNGDLWIATNNSGFYQFSSHVLQENHSINNLLIHERPIQGVCREINKVAIFDNKVIHFINEEAKLMRRLVLPKKYAFERINKMRHCNGHLYIQTIRYILQYDYETDFFIEIFDKNELRANGGHQLQYKDFYIQNNGSIIMCYNNVIEINDKNIINEIKIPSAPRVTTIKYYNDSLFIIGTLRGAFVFNSNRPKTIKNISDIQDTPVVFIDRDSRGNLYCVHLDGSISVLEWIDGVFNDRIELGKTFEGVNFSDAKITDNQLSLATSQGLFVFSIPEMTLIHQPSEIAGQANWNIEFVERLGDHHFLASSRKFAIHNQKSKSKTEHINVFIDRIDIDGEEVLNGRSIFNFDEQGIKFTYTAPYFGSANLLYEHQLENHESDFIRTIDAKAVYANLNPGDYVFKVRARVNEVETSNIATYSFTILPPWWRTWWFYMICSISGIGILYYFYQDSKKKNQARLSLLQQRLNALHAQMNPHFLFNGLQSLQYYIATNNSKKAMAYLTSFATLVRKTLESSAHDFISIADETDYLKSYLTLEKEKLEDNLNFDFNWEDDTLLNIIIPSMVLQPFVENAIVHGFQNRKVENKLLISFKKLNAKQILCTISDNGLGIQHNLKKKLGHKSFATNAIEAKLKLLDQLHVGSNSAKSINITMLNHAEIEQPQFKTGMTIQLILPIIKKSQLNN